MTRREFLGGIIGGVVYTALGSIISVCSPTPTPEAPIDQSKVYNFENFLEILKNNNLIDEEVYPFISESSRVPVLVETPEGKSILTFSEESFRELVEKRIKIVIKAYEDLARRQGDLVILNIPPNLRNLLNLDFYEMDIVLLRVKISESEYLLLPINFLKKEILDRFSDESRIKALPTIQIDEEASLRAIGQIVEKNNLGLRIEREEIIDGIDLTNHREPNKNTKLYTKSGKLVPKEARWVRVLELRKDYPNLDGSTHFIFFYNEQGKCIRVSKISSSQFRGGVRTDLSEIDWHARLRHDLDHLISGLRDSIPEKVIRNEELIREIFQHFSENPNQPFVRKIGLNQTIKFEVPHKNCILIKTISENTYIKTISENTYLIYGIRGFLKIESEGGKRLVIYPAELYRLESGRFYGFLNIGSVTSFTGLNIRADLLKNRWALKDIEKIPPLSGFIKTGSFSEIFEILRKSGKSPLAAVKGTMRRIPEGATNILDSIGLIYTIYTMKENFDEQQKSRKFLDTFPKDIREKLEKINLGLDFSDWREEWRAYTSFGAKSLTGGELKSVGLVVIPPYSKRSIIQPEMDIIDRWYTESGKLGIFVLKVEPEKEDLQQDKDTAQKEIYTLVIFDNNPNYPNKPYISLRYVTLPEVNINEIFEFPVSNMYYYNPNFHNGLYFRIYAGVLKGEDGEDRIVIFLITNDSKSLPVNLNKIGF